MGFQIQVRGTWAGGCSTHTWYPAVAGTINQTGLSDEEASTFDTWESAQAALEDVIGPELTDAQRDGAAYNAPQFRIVEVS